MPVGLPNLYGTNLVMGEGPIPCQFMLIGEAPGEQEDRLGKPFCGQAGATLGRLISMNCAVKRSDIYITNAVKQRPPNNRKPTIEEILKHRGFLIAEIQVIKPRVIVTLGKTALEAVLGQEVGTLGAWITDEYPRPILGTDVYVTYHPAVLFHSGVYLKDIETALQHLR